VPKVRPLLAFTLEQSLVFLLLRGGIVDQMSVIRFSDSTAFGALFDTATKRLARDI